MKIYKEDNGKVSSKRVIALATAALVLLIVALKIFGLAESVETMLLLGLFGEAVILLGVARFGGGFNRVGGQIPPTDDEYRNKVGGELPKTDDE